MGNTNGPRHSARSSSPNTEPPTDPSAGKATADSSAGKKPPERTHTAAPKPRRRVEEEPKPATAPPKTASGSEPQASATKAKRRATTKPAPQAASEQASAPSFGLDDFVQDASAHDASAWTSEAIHDSRDSDEEFTWFQDAVEQESEDIAAWGATHDSGAPFIWFQDPLRKPITSVRAQSAASASPQSTHASATATPTKSGTPSHFRPEIEGLRAVAVFMIVVYHVWLGRVSGGVDVFLFISAFLLGSSFARRLDAGGSFAPVKYWLRTFTRLMPPAVIAISGTLLAAYFVLPPSAWQNVITHAIASATYVQNIVLSTQAVDYYALDASQASPLQHFWSLSLQGQVFLTWPLLFMMVALLARKSRHPRRMALTVFGTIAAASFAYSVWFTATNQSAAYFSTPARLWEVSAGTILALALPRLDRMLGAHRPGAGQEPRHRTLRAIAGWSGFALLVSLGLVLDVQGLFPGWIGMWPLTGAALIIIAGYSGSRWGFDRILTMKAPRALASSSYSLYLVHWPILIFWLASSGRSRAGLLDGLVVIVGSMTVAWVLSKVVDAQFRSPVWKTAPPLRSLAVIGLCLTLVLGGSFGWRTMLSMQTTQPEIGAGGETPETDPLTEPFDAAKLAPKGHELDSQWPSLPYDCAGQEGAPPAKDHVPCQTLQPVKSQSDFVVMVVGSSHSRQYIPALTDTAKKKNWQIISLSMDGCSFVNDPNVGGYCKGYYEYATQQIERYKPDLVVTTATSAHPDSANETVPVGGSEAIHAITDKGIDVLAFRDNPRWSANAYTCAEKVIESGGSPEEADQTCGAPLNEKLAATNPLASLEEQASGAAPEENTGASDARGKVVTIDVSDRTCPNGRCSPIVGNRYVYMDDNHLTRAFTTAIAPDVSKRLEKAGIGTQH